MVWCVNHGGIKDYLDRYEDLDDQRWFIKVRKHYYNLHFEMKKKKKQENKNNSQNGIRNLVILYFCFDFLFSL